MLKITELSKRKRPQGLTDTELSPFFVQLLKRDTQNFYNPIKGPDTVYLLYRKRTWDFLGK